MGVYLAKEKGHCGPCSFINLLGIKGNLELERELIERGRAKPFFNSDWTSFLIWADKYNIDLDVFLTTLNFHKEQYKRLGIWANIDKKKFESLRNMAEKRYKILLKKYFHKIALIKNPIRKIDSLLESGDYVAFLTNTFYSKKRPFLPHFFVIYDKEGNNYLIKDSAYNIKKLSSRQIKKGLEINKKNHIYPQLISYKNQKAFK